MTHFQINYQSVGTQDLGGHADITSTVDSRRAASLLRLLCAQSSIGLTVSMRAVGIREDEKNTRTHSLAARIIRALRSRRLASRFSAVSSHTALPPASNPLRRVLYAMALILRAGKGDV